MNEKSLGDGNFVGALKCHPRKIHLCVLQHLCARLALFFSSLMAQTVKNLPAMQEIQVRFLGREDPLEGRACQSTLVFLPGELHGQATVCEVAKSWT